LESWKLQLFFAADFLASRTTNVEPQMLSTMNSKEMAALCCGSLEMAMAKYYCKKKMLGNLVGVLSFNSKRSSASSASASVQCKGEGQ
jgi:hypothetical protein